MTASAIDFFDDFGTYGPVGLDRSKWQAPTGNVTIAAAGGVVLGSDVLSVLTSADTWNLYGSRVNCNVTSQTTGGTGSYFALARDDGVSWLWRCTGSSIVAAYIPLGGAETNVASYGWNANDFRWLAIRHNQFDGRLHWDSSRDGITWVGRCSFAVTATNWAHRVRFAAGPPSTGNLTVRYVNTSVPIQRGPGYLTEPFDHLKSGAVPAGACYGPFRALIGSGSSVVTENGSDKAWQSVAGWGVQNLTRTDMRAKIKDVDVSVDVTFVSQVAVPVGQTRGPEDCPKISWRVQGDVDANTRYRLIINRDGFSVDKAIAGSNETLYVSEIGTLLGVTYRWRVVHSGSSIVVYRDSGDFLSTGRHSLPTEVARCTDNEISSAGNVAFSTYSSTARFDNVHIEAGRVNASVPRALPFRARQWGAYGTRGDHTDHTPMTTDLAVLPTLEALARKRFAVASWYTDNVGSFPSAAAHFFCQQGKNNLIAVETTTWSMASVVNGDHDDWFTTLAQSIAGLPTQSFVRLWPEFNADWAPWSVGYSTCPYTDHSLSMATASPAEFVAGWRQVAGIFRKYAPTAQLVWCVNADDVPRTNALEDYWPGSSYVDVLGIDGYNYGITGDGYGWQTHADVLTDAYDRLVALAPAAPVWVCELGCKEPTENDGKDGYTPVTQPPRSPVDSSHDKGQWVHDLMAETGLANVTTIVLFNSDQQRDWRIDSSASSLTAWQEEFTAQSALAAAGVPDPELSPQPVPVGQPATASGGPFEYIRLEEDGYQPLLISPSLGGLWYADLDLGFPAARPDVSARPLAPGTYDYTALSGAKSVAIQVEVVDYLTAGIQYQLDLLARWMQPGRRPTLVYKPRGEPERRLLLRPDQMSAPIPVAQRAHAAVQLQFVAPSGVAVASDQHVVTLAATDTGPTDAVTYGTTVAYPVIRIYGPATNPLVVNQTLDSVNANARLGLTIVLDADQFIELDCMARTVRLNGWEDPSADRRSALTTARWFGLAPFRNALQLTSDVNADATPASGTADATYADSWSL